MKKLLVIALVVAVTLIGASSAMAKIAGSKHDLSTTSTNTSAKAVGVSVSACQFCHTPHLGNFTSPLGTPLWNRTITTGYTNAANSGNYTVYGAAGPGVAGSTLSQTGGVTAPGANSKTCLSCHDGTLALSAILVGNNSGITGWTGFDVPAYVTTPGGLLTGGPSGLGTDLKQEHPIGITYNSTLTGPGLNGPANIDANFKVLGVWKLYGGGDTVGKVECGSCHDPHANDNIAGGVNAPFLKGSIQTICTDCHSAK